MSESADNRNTRREHDLGDLGDLMGPALVADVELGAAERHDRRRVKDPDDELVAAARAQLASLQSATPADG